MQEKPVADEVWMISCVPSFSCRIKFIEKSHSSILFNFHKACQFDVCLKIGRALLMDSIYSEIFKGSND